MRDCRVKIKEGNVQTIRWSQRRIRQMFDDRDYNKGNAMNNEGDSNEKCAMFCDRDYNAGRIIIYKL